MIIIIHFAYFCIIFFLSWDFQVVFISLILWITKGVVLSPVENAIFFTLFFLSSERQSEQGLLFLNIPFSNRITKTISGFCSLFMTWVSAWKLGWFTLIYMIFPFLMIAATCLWWVILLWILRAIRMASLVILFTNMVNILPNNENILLSHFNRARACCSLNLSLYSFPSEI